MGGGGLPPGFLSVFGVTLEWAEVRLLTRLGGGELRANRPPGKRVLTRGLRRLLDLFAAQAILEAEVQQHGDLPPRLAALLGRSKHVTISSTCFSGQLRRYCWTNVTTKGARLMATCLASRPGQTKVDLSWLASPSVVIL